MVRPRSARIAPNLLRLVAVGYVTLLVGLPVGVLVWRTFQPGLSAFFNAITDPASVNAFERTLTVAAISTAIDAVFGVAAAILLVRRRFIGRRLLDAIIDLPVAVSPIVVGLALMLVYGVGGWFGLGRGDVIGSTLGMVLATVFVSFPLVLRAVAPTLEEIGTDQEMAAASLGAGPVTVFRRITLPAIRVALGYGVVLTLARCLGEFGAVLVVSSNFARSQTAPLRISTLLQVDFEPHQAYAIAFVLMVVAVLAIALVSFLQRSRSSS
ncbi:putative sulfate ABC transporter, permease protein CysW [Nocardioides baekrokdamisoli]|uniref:Putative sulfate ABC transporter, permease protein CysW n=1 Tax=Nocardioides baekrokdamisoli TaxID=1804624 RepID=A0A3G9IVG7_9ACTN|nr:ABC transporter permease subunit [Nocardioides baekrokdamisoli]BBH17671.1 putative sulfate ABC transporter, permease protein CysW [Nocardioides baekrokdamisoli]